MKKVINSVVGVLIGVGLILGVKGDEQSFTNNRTYDSLSIGGPFESSHSSSRYALTKAIVEEGTFFLNEQLAAMSSPDLTKVGDRYISIFTPGVSFLAVPAYIIGKSLGYPQLGAYTISLIAAAICVYLIAAIVKNMTGNYRAGIAAGVIFLFGTNAYVYAETMTQHLISTAILLGLIVFAQRYQERKIYHYAGAGLAIGLAIVVDIPNAFLLVPILVYILSRSILTQLKNHQVQLRINKKILVLGAGGLVMAMVFALYNADVTGSPFKLGQRLGRAIYPPDASIEQQKIVTSGPKEKFKQFDTKRILDGTYILLFSKTRGLFHYSPVIALGVLGLVMLYRRSQDKAVGAMLIATSIVNILLYAMFNDPWGGWAFGPRYLIPTIGILAVGLGNLLDEYRKYSISLLVIAPLVVASIYLSVVGTMTTSVVPPDVYTQNLAEKVHSNYKYNFDLIRNNKSGSLVYNMLFKKYITVREYILIVTGLLSVGALSVCGSVYVPGSDKKGKNE